MILINKKFFLVLLIFIFLFTNIYGLEKYCDFKLFQKYTCYTEYDDGSHAEKTCFMGFCGDPTYYPKDYTYDSPESSPTPTKTPVNTGGNTGTSGTGGGGTTYKPPTTPTDTPINPPYTPSYHNVCRNYKCVRVLGAGSNRCSSNSDCCVYPSSCPSDYSVNSCNDCNVLTTYYSYTPECENFCSKSSSSSITDNCCKYEQEANDPDGDDPNEITTCKGGIGSSCKDGKCITTKQSDKRDYCDNTTKPYVFYEYIINDSEDCCSGKDRCDSKQYDPDVGKGACELGCELHWNPGGNEDSINGDTKCCEDDPNEYYIGSYLENPDNHPKDDLQKLNDACCDDEDDCVYNGICHTSSKDGYHETGIQNEDGSLSTNDYENDASCYDSIDNDCDGNTDFCDSYLQSLDPKACRNFNEADDDCLSTITIRVTKEQTKYNDNGNLISYQSNIPASNVEVTLSGVLRYHNKKYQIKYNNITNNDGEVTFKVYGNLTYNIFVQSNERLNVRYTKYEPITSKLFAPFRNQIELKYELKERFNKCEADCTYLNDEICHRDCNGIRGCKFYDDKSAGLCDGKFKGIAEVYKTGEYYDYWVNCCEGVPIQNAFKHWKLIINSSDVVTYSKKTMYRGHPVYLKIAIWPEKQ